MFKYIVVPATGDTTDDPVFATALSIARISAAHLEFMHVSVDVERTLTAMASSDVAMGVNYTPIAETLQRDLAARREKAQQAVRSFCANRQLALSDDISSPAPTAEWRTEIGDEPACLAARGRGADLLVLGRSREGEAVAMDVLEACLMTTGRPVVIASAKVPPTLPGTVLIAWKDRPEAARAVAHAMPLIEKAARVIIACVQEDAVPDKDSCELLRRTLSWHNVNISVEYLKADAASPVETLLRAAAETHADLLVMGGYGHSRVREIMFGGFTRHILAAADLPVFMAH